MREPKEQSAVNDRPTEDTAWFSFATGMPSALENPAEGYYSQPEVYEYPSEAELQAARQHNLEVTAEASEHFTDMFMSADSAMARFDAAREFVSQRNRQILRAHTDSVYADYAAAHTAFTAYQAAYQQTDSLYIRRLIEWGMSREIHEITPWPAEATLYHVTPDIDWDDWFYEHKPAGHVDVELSDLAQSLLAEHPEYQAMVVYGAELAAKEPTLGDDDYHAPDPYRALMREMSAGGQNDAQLAGLQYELALETSSLFGVSMSDLSEAARDRLFEYGLSLDQATYERIKDSILRLHDRKVRASFAESFLLTEAVSDRYGDKLLAIAEQASPAQLEQLTTTLVDFLRLNQYYARMFAGYDSQLEQAVVRCSNENLSKPIAVIEKVATQRSGVTVSIQPGSRERKDKRFDVTYADIQSILEDIELRHQAMLRGQAIMDDPQTVWTMVVRPGQGLQVYRANSLRHGSMIVHTRTEGASRYDAALEYGTRGGVEASTDVSVYMGEEQTPVPDIKSGNFISVFRLDREGRLPTDAPSAAHRHAINEAGLISYDTGSVTGRKDSLAYRSTAPFAAGDVIITQDELRGQPTLHHNTDYFDQQQWGAAANFRRLVEWNDAWLTERCMASQRRTMSKIASRLTYLEGLRTDTTSTVGLS